MIEKLGYEQTSVRVEYDTTYGIILAGQTEKAADLISREMRELSSMVLLRLRRTVK